MNKAYERETEMWNQVFKECTPVDLRNLDLQVEAMFDEALKMFAQKTTNVLDFGCGTGDISFQYLQYQPTHKVLGIDASKTGIEFATETAKLSDYKTATFLEGTDHTVKQLEENSFDFPLEPCYYGDIIDCCLEQDLMDVNTGHFVRRIRTAARQSGKGRVNLQEETGEVNERVADDRFLSE